MKHELFQNLSMPRQASCHAQRRLRALFWSTILLCGLFHSAAAQNNWFQPPFGMVAWWPMDDPVGLGLTTTVLDSSNHGHTGSLKDDTGSPVTIGSTYGPITVASVIPTESQVVNALFFCMTYAEVASSADFDIGENGLTITLWFISGGAITPIQPLLDKWDSTSTSGYSLYLDSWNDTNNTYNLNFKLNGNVIAFPITSNFLWYFVAVTVQNDTATIYINSPDPQAPSTLKGAIHKAPVTNWQTSNTAPLWIAGNRSLPNPSGACVSPIAPGACNNPYQTAIGGYPAAELFLDEVEIFNRALGLNEMKSIYNAESIGLGKCLMVDGLKDDFYNTLTGPNNGYLHIRYYAYNDNGAPANDADLSAKVWTAWDNEWFHLYEEVMDDTLSANATNVYEEDEIEMLFDPQPTDSVTNSIRETRLTALGPATGVVAWDNLNNVNASQKLWARRTIAGGYALELAIKWSAIQSGSETITPAVGNIFGMAINQHDNDGHAQRQATVQWAAVLLDAVWNTPKYLGTVKFLANNKLQFIPTNNMTGVTNPVPYDGSDYTPTGIKNASTTIPETFNLGQNYPNPFNPSTSISFSLPTRSFVSLKVFDLTGREVATIVSGELLAGKYTRQLNAANISSGIYFYRLQAGKFIETKKLILLR